MIRQDLTRRLPLLIRHIAIWLCMLTLLVPITDVASSSNLAEVRGHVWHDVNEDGLRDPGEPGLSDVLIILADRTGTALRSTHTNNAGEYRFVGLTAGDYLLCETDPDGFGSTTPNLVAISVPEGATIHQDFGDTRLLPGCWHAVDGYIWHDVNANGRRETSEEPLRGVPLRVLNLQSELVAITASNPYGFYKVHGVPPERYYLILDPPADLAFAKAPLHWGVDLRGCVPPVIDIGFQRHLEAAWSCSEPRDLVGPGNTALHPDGITDGAIDIWLNTNPQRPTFITRVLVEVENAGQSWRWDTDPATEDWAVAVMDPRSLRMLNPDVTFHHLITEHVSLRLYISDLPGNPTFSPGAVITLTAQTSSDGVWTTSATISACSSMPATKIPLHPTAGNSSLRGTVWALIPHTGSTSTVRKALSGVKLTLLDATSHQIVAEKVSDASGQYHFADLAGWRAYYLIQEVPSGYEPVLSSYWGVAVTDSCEVIINLENRPVPAGQIHYLYLPQIVVAR